MPETTLKEHLSRAGSASTPRKRKASLANLAKANAAMTPEIRRLAGEKGGRPKKVKK